MKRLSIIAFVFGVASFFGESDASCIYDLANLNCPEDLNLDNQVNTSDLLVFLGAYGQNCD